MSLTPRVLTADRGDDGLRLDLVLRRHLQDLRSATRTRVQSWIETGLVTVNGAAVRRVSSRAALGDIVSILLPEEAPRAVMAAEDVAVDVLYEDDELLAVNKPAGLVVHPTYKHTARDADERAAVARARRGRRRSGRRSSAASTSSRPASSSSPRRPAAHAALQRAMAANDAEKDYLAIVYGRVNVARGEIDLRLGTDRDDRRKVVASATVGRGEPDAIRTARRASRRRAPGCRCSAAAWRPDERTRSACIWRRAAGRWSAIRRTASRDGPRSTIRCSRRRCGRFPGRRCTPGGWGSRIRSRARGSTIEAPVPPDLDDAAGCGRTRRAYRPTMTFSLAILAVVLSYTWLIEPIAPRWSTPIAGGAGVGPGDLARGAAAATGA